MRTVLRCMYLYAGTGFWCCAWSQFYVSCSSSSVVIAAKQHEGALHDGDACVAQRRAAHLVASVAPSRLCVLAKLRSALTRVRHLANFLLFQSTAGRSTLLQMRTSAPRFTLVTHAASAVLSARMSTSTAATGNGVAGEE